MTGRERLLAICAGKPVDRLSWTTLADDVTRSAMPDDIRGLPILDFYRAVGCDVLQFGNYGLPLEQAVASCRLVRPEVRVTDTPGADGSVVHEEETPWGTLTQVFKNGHPISYPVTDLAGVRILTQVWQHSRYEAVPDAGRNFAAIEERIGEAGLYIPTLSPSPVQQLLEMDTGVESFSYLLTDHPVEVRELLDAMHRCRMQEYELVAGTIAAPAVIPVENTSTSLISPTLYREYSLPQIRDFTRLCHRHGKKAILHMCGLLKNLLPALAETGLDGINGLTPVPVGDISFERVLDELGDELIIFGGVLPGNVFHDPAVTADDIRRLLDRIFTPRVRAALFVLWVAVDGLATPLWKFLTVRDWMDKNGGLHGEA